MPTNALFNAYYALLPTIGIDTDHDSRYARVLFKIGGLPGSGRLYEKFESVLSRMGIEIQFDGDAAHDNHDDESLQEDHHVSQEDIPTTSQVLGNHHLQGTRPRRSSESTIWDFAPEPERLVRRPRSQSSLSRPDAGLLDRPFLRERKHHANERAVRQADEPSALSKMGKYVGAWLSTTVEPPESSEPGPFNGKGAKVTSRTNSVAEDTEYSVTDAFSHTEGEVLSTNGVTDLSRASSAEVIPDSGTILNIKASLIRDHHLENRIRRILITWQQQSKQRQISHISLYQFAEHRDHQLLLRQAFETWRTSVRQRHLVAETENFFALLGSRASKARDLFLLTKAFTHWAQTTSDEVERTSLARRHILRTRLFKAWRDITAVNELKARRQILKRFFGQWQKRHRSVGADARKAVVAYEDNLVQRKYWLWFWSFCERKAPLWRETRVKRTSLGSWISQTRDHAAVREVANRHESRSSKARPLRCWISRSNKTAEAEMLANQNFATSLLMKCVLKWSSESALLRPRFKIQNLIAARLKYTSFTTWRMRADQERVSTALDRQKVLKEAFSTWNDGLRCRVIQGRIGERIMSQALYQWVIAERLALAQRVSAQRLQYTILGLLQHRQATHLRSSYDASQQAQEFLGWNTKHRTLRLLRHALQKQSQLEMQADSIYVPRVAHRSLERWHAKCQHVQDLKDWAKMGEFYFLARKYLKRWNASTKQSRKDKRRKVYNYLRRENKMRLAKDILASWREKTQSALVATKQASVIYHNKTIVIGVEVFDRWRARSEDIAELDVMRRRPMANKALRKWRNTLTDIQNLDIEAKSYNEDRATDHCLKLWTRAALQLRGREFVVQEVRDKRIKRVLRRMLLYWRQKTPYSKQSTDDGSATLQAQSRMGETIRAEVWSEFGDDLDAEDWAKTFDGQQEATPLPGYLATPSKRAYRVRASARQASTTPMAPLSTPFEKLLRDQYSGGSLASFRRTQKRDEMTGGGFADIGKSG